MLNERRSPSASAGGARVGTLGGRCESREERKNVGAGAICPAWKTRDGKFRMRSSKCCRPTKVVFLDDGPVINIPGTARTHASPARAEGRHPPVLHVCHGGGLWGKHVGAQDYLDRCPGDLPHGRGGSRRGLAFGERPRLQRRLQRRRPVGHLPEGRHVGSRAGQRAGYADSTPAGVEECRPAAQRRQLQRALRSAGGEPERGGLDGGALPELHRRPESRRHPRPDPAAAPFQRFAADRQR